MIMVERGVKPEQGELFLPPGFRFHPTDEEVITSYLLQKLLNPSFAPLAIGEVNLNTYEPWDLPSKAKMGEKEWYFFSHKDMKYPTGMRTNRATKEGYWKATGRDREIFKPASGAAGSELVGMKKTLVFYMGRAPRGSKTNWVMHEFRVEGKYRDNKERLSRKDEWVVCKVFHKNNGDRVDKKAAAAVDSSVVGTPNVSSISVAADATGDGDDFIDSMFDPMYFNSTSSSLLPDFADLPNYTISDTTSRNLNQAASAVVANSTSVPRSSSYSYDSSSWNLLHAAGHHPTMGSYNLHDQAMMARALGGGGVIPPRFSGGLPSSSSSSSVPGVLQQNSRRLTQHKIIGSYSDNTSYATHLTRRAAPAPAPATAPAAGAESLGAGAVL